MPPPGRRKGDREVVLTRLIQKRVRESEREFPEAPGLEMRVPGAESCKENGEAECRSRERTSDRLCDQGLTLLRDSSRGTGGRRSPCVSSGESVQRDQGAEVLGAQGVCPSPR